MPLGTGRVRAAFWLRDVSNLRSALEAASFESIARGEGEREQLHRQDFDDRLHGGWNLWQMKNFEATGPWSYERGLPSVR